jgi:hypothetical protein
MYVLAQSHARINKERPIGDASSNGCGRVSSSAVFRTSHEARRRALKVRAAWGLIDVEVAEKDATFTFALNRDKL